MAGDTVLPGDLDRTLFAGSKASGDPEMQDYLLRSLRGEHLKLLIAARDVTMIPRDLKMTGHSPLHEK
jgi:hypothetical protein